MLMCTVDEGALCVKDHELFLTQKVYFFFFFFSSWIYTDAETIRVTYDETKLSYNDMLDLFFSFHTPSDPRFAGTQYRSAIFTHTDEQKQLAKQAVQDKGRVGSWVAVEDASDFYQAEEYHQKYIDKMTGRL